MKRVKTSTLLKATWQLIDKQKKSTQHFIPGTPLYKLVRSSAKAPI